MNDINVRIQEVRSSLHLTQSDFSKKLGITQSNLSRIEKGFQVVTDRLIKDICREYNVSENWLRHGEGEMFVKLEGEFLELIASELDGLDDLDRKFISEYIKLPPQHRQMIKEFIRKMAT